MKYIVMITIVILAGCGADNRTRPSLEWVCGDDTAEKRADFILQCIDKGNPMSDEEPEDWIWICGKMAREVMCKEERVIIHEHQTAPGKRWIISDKILNNSDEGMK